jgi:hypothetical protein
LIVTNLNDDTVSVLLGNAIGNVNGQIYTIVPIGASAITRLSPATVTTGANSVTYAVTFNNPVTGVEPADFQVATTGGVVASRLVAVSGSGSSYSVTVSGIHGQGTVELNLIDNDGIHDSRGNPLGGPGDFNGSFLGQAYTILQKYPSIVSINRASPSGSTISASTVNYTVTFSAAVNGVTPADFQSVTTGNVTVAGPIDVSGSGAAYTVTVNGISGSGTLALELADNGSIHDSVGNPLQTPTALAGNFGPQQTYETRGASSIAAADLNQDGTPDLVFGTGFLPGSIGVLLANGNGTFQNTMTSGAVNSPGSLAIGDLNGDGIPDVAVLDTGLAVLLGNANGSFGTANYYAAGTQPHAIALGDFNGDGKLDVVVTELNAGLIEVFLGNGDGTLQPRLTFATGVSPYAVAVADVNGDGIPDVVVANHGSNTIGVFLGNGDGTFKAQQTFRSLYQPTSIAVGDVNGDGIPDVVVAGGTFGSQAIGIFLGNGNGTFQTQTTLLAGNTPVSVVIADTNGDAYPDLIVTNRYTDNVSVFQGNGDGTFAPQVTYASGFVPGAVVAADFNQDGRPDLAVDNYDGGTLGVMLAGNATFLGQTYSIANAETITGSAGNDNITIKRDPDGVHSDWTIGSTSGQLPLNDPAGLTINGNGSNDTITLDYTNGSPLPNVLHLNSGTGNFTINGLQGTNPLAGTTLEIGRSTVFISYSSSDPIAAIQGYLHNGYNAGAWNGSPTATTGVITSAAAQANPNHNTAIAYADSADGQGVNTTPNTIELTYTLYGDANLDHQVNSADLQILLAFLNRTGGWDQGDFNYDAQVNSADLQALLFTLNTSLGSQATPLAVAAAPVAATTTSAPSAAGNPSSQLMPAINATGLTTTPIHHPHPAKISARKRR